MTKLRSGWIGLVAVVTIWAAPADAQFGAFRGEESKIAYFRLAGTMTEAPNEFGLFAFGSEPPMSLHTLLERFRQARTDSSVKAVILAVEMPVVGWAQAQELRDAVAGLRAAGKEVYCHVELLDTKTYYLVSSASQLSMVPAGYAMLTGLYGESIYLKGTLDKLNCRADYEHIGEYKSAAETLTQSGPSPEAEAMQNWLFDSLYEQIVKGIAESRRLSEDRVRELIDRGLFSAEQCNESGLLDAVQHRQDFLADVKERYGRTIKIDKGYGRRKGPEIDFSSPFGLFKFFNEVMQGATGPMKDAVAVVYAEGMIISGRSQASPIGGNIMGSTTLRAALDKARTDDSIRAVVLRIDSPGGSAVASEVIYDAGRRLAEAKPLIVSMGNVAGSGGYYIAAGAKTIFAQPSTITGSIGVVGGKIVTKGVWDLIGVTSHEYTRGRSADLLSTNRPFTDEQRKRFRDWMADIYTVFTNRVMEGRGEKLDGPLEKIARGRVFTGAQAVDNGLIDRLGGLDDAIRFAAREARIGEYDIRVLPQPKTIFDLLLEGFGVSDEDEDATLGRVQPFGADSPLIAPMIPLLQQADPIRAAALGRMLLRIELMRKGGVLAVMPNEFVLP